VKIFKIGKKFLRLQFLKQMCYIHIMQGSYACRALLSIYRALLSIYRALLSIYRALLSIYRALLSIYRALLAACRFAAACPLKRARSGKGLIYVYKYMPDVCYKF